MPRFKYNICIFVYTQISIEIDYKYRLEHLDSVSGIGMFRAKALREGVRKHER